MRRWTALAVCTLLLTSIEGVGIMLFYRKSTMPFYSRHSPAANKNLPKQDLTRAIQSIPTNISKYSPPFSSSAIAKGSLPVVYDSNLTALPTSAKVNANKKPRSPYQQFQKVPTVDSLANSSSLENANLSRGGGQNDSKSSSISIKLVNTNTTTTQNSMKRIQNNSDITNYTTIAKTGNSFTMINDPGTETHRFNISSMLNTSSDNPHLPSNGLSSASSEKNMSKLFNGKKIEQEFQTVEGVIGSLKSPLILSVVNTGYIPLLLNLLASIARLSIKTNILVICEEKEAYLNLLQTRETFPLYFQIVLTYLPSSPSEALVFKTQKYKDLVRKRISYIKLLLKAGIDILYIDTDIVLLEDPFAYMDSEHDVFIQFEMGKWLCSGFVYFTARHVTIDFIRAWAKNVQQDRQGNQIIFNRFLNTFKKKEHGMKVKVLPSNRFMSGFKYRQSPNYWFDRDPPPVEIHANFMVGRDTKVQWLKDNKLWFVD